MQSMNEELQTVNHEQQAKMEELARANSDMKNLLNSTDIATVFLDNDLNLRRFTTQATKLIPLIPSDVGRPITDIVSDLHYPELTDDAREVLRTLVPVEKQVSARNGRWFAARIMPYRTLENVIDGLAVTFTDITASRKLEATLRQTSEVLRTILEGISDAFFSLDDNLVLTHFNPAAERLFNRKSINVVGKPLFEAIAPIKGSTLDKKCRQALKEKAFISFEGQLESAPDGGWYDARVYPHSGGVSVILQTTPAHQTTAGRDTTQEPSP